MNIPVEPTMLRDVGVLARLKGMSIGDFVRSVLADAVARDLNPALLKEPSEQAAPVA